MEKISKTEFKFKDFGYEGLHVYRLAYQLAMEVFEVTKSFPREEVYSLTDQVRRSSRSVCANIGEGYRKRIYPKFFVSKMVDSDGECTETMIHLNFADDCNYISKVIKEYFEKNYGDVGRILNSMMKHPEKFLPNKISMTSDNN